MTGLNIETAKKRLQPFRDAFSLRAWAVVQGFWHALVLREESDLRFGRSVMRDAMKGHVPEELMVSAYMTAEDDMPELFETAEESSDGAIEEAFILSVNLSVIPEGRRNSRFLKPFLDVSVRHFRGCSECRSKAVLVFQGVWELSAMGHAARAILSDADEK